MPYLVSILSCLLDFSGVGMEERESKIYLSTSLAPRP